MWKFQHSIECPVSRDFAWQFWSNVNHWAAVDPAVESVMLNGPFIAGARGTTKPRGLAPVDWQLAEVQEGRGAVIEIPAPGATARFQWRFEDSSDGGARITQEVTIEGEQADDYIRGFAPELEKGIPPGMQKLAEAMVKAAGEQA